MFQLEGAKKKTGIQRYFHPLVPRTNSAISLESDDDVIVNEAGYRPDFPIDLTPPKRRPADELLAYKPFTLSSDESIEEMPVRPETFIEKVNQAKERQRLREDRYDYDVMESVVLARNKISTAATANYDDFDYQRNRVDNSTTDSSANDLDVGFAAAAADAYHPLHRDFAPAFETKPKPKPRPLTPEEQLEANIKEVVSF